MAPPPSCSTYHAEKVACSRGCLARIRNVPRVFLGAVPVKAKALDLEQPSRILIKVNVKAREAQVRGSAVVANDLGPAVEENISFFGRSDRDLGACLRVAGLSHCRFRSNSETLFFISVSQLKVDNIWHQHLPHNIRSNSRRGYADRVRNCASTLNAGDDAGSLPTSTWAVARAPASRLPCGAGLHVART